MKLNTITVFTFLVVSYSAGIDVVFYEGFEGEEFPPPGWVIYNGEHANEGYESDRSAVLLGDYDHPSNLTSPYINVFGNSLYRFKFYSKMVDAFWEYTTPAILEFDRSDPYPIFIPFDGNEWYDIVFVLITPPCSSQVRFVFDTNQYYYDGGVWYLDEFEVALIEQGDPPPGLTSLSLGCVKAAYR
jgi:hypothetical protein